MNFPKDKFAWTVTVGEKGQIVIPKAAREMFSINAGDTIIILADKKRGLAIPIQSRFSEIFTKTFPSDGEEK